MGLEVAPPEEHGHVWALRSLAGLGVGARAIAQRVGDRHTWNCTSFGVMQTKKPETWVKGATPAKVAADRRLGLRVGLAAFRWCLKATAKGGVADVRASLRLYSSGRVDRAFVKVAARCAWVGC